MKRIILLFALCIAVAFAQPTLTQTSLSSAVTSSTTQSLIVASATNITVTPVTSLYIDKELMLVLGVNGTTITVARGQSGTAAVKHASGAMVLAGSPSQFYTYNPTGSCTAATITVTPWVNVYTSNQFLCSSVTGTWVPGWQNTSVPAQVTAAVASAAGLIVPSGPLFHITGTNAITGFTIPVGYTNGPVCVIPDAIFTTTNATNIALGSTAVVNKTLCWTFDGTNGKFVPSY